LYELFSKMMSELEYEALHKIFGYFYSDKNEYLRNEFCKHLLDFSSVVNDIAEILFIKVKNNLYHKFPGDLDRFLNIYYCEVKKTMNEEVKKMCKEVGEGIGIFASGGYKDGKERKNLLYALRNSDTLQKFVNVINSVMIEEFGIAKRDVIQKLLDSLDKRNWELTKEFILAYSLNKYLGIKYAQKMGGEKQ